MFKLSFPKQDSHLTLIFHTSRKGKLAFMLCSIQMWSVSASHIGSILYLACRYLPKITEITEITIARNVD